MRIRTVLMLLSITAGVLGMMLLTSNAFAEMKIAKVNLSAVSENSTRIKAAMEDMKKVQLESAPKLTVLSNEIKKLEDQLQAGEATLPKEEKDKLENEIQTKRQEMQQEQQSIRVKLAFKQKSLGNVVRTQLNEILEKIAKEEKYNAILSSDVVLYSDGVPDLTEKVTKALDAMPALEITPK